MSFSRLQYDRAAYERELVESTGPGRYVLQTPWHKCSPCLSTDPSHGPFSAPATCVDVPLIDLSSDLLGITRRASRDPSCEHSPGASLCTRVHPVPDCDRMHQREDTRLSNPPQTLRATGFNRWEWPCRNPQDRVEMPFDTMINSQLLARDNHRPIVPRPIDPALALPPDDNAPSIPEIESRARDDACQRQVADNLPIVSWRTCDDLDRIMR